MAGMSQKSLPRLWGAIVLTVVLALLAELCVPHHHPNAVSGAKPAFAQSVDDSRDGHCRADHLSPQSPELTSVNGLAHTDASTADMAATGSVHPVRHRRTPQWSPSGAARLVRLCISRI